jgi:PHD/YefM family antitoxin component YafN of YafNO toxin-antitoxin module
MKHLNLTDNAVSLRDAVHSLGHEPAAVLQDGRPVAVLLPVEGADMETVALSLNPQFLAILARSTARQSAEGGVSGEEMRRRLAVDASPPEKAKRNGRRRDSKRTPSPKKPKGFSKQTPLQ